MWEFGGGDGAEEINYSTEIDICVLGVREFILNTLF